MERVIGMLPEWLRKHVSIDGKGNVIIGRNKIINQSGDVKNNVLVGDGNSIISDAAPGQRVVISGNTQIGRGNSIVVTSKENKTSKS
jgi:NDP-sugar pyrophosphorylase family protein